MHKIRKLLWMILILWIVFFIICDERWIKIEWDKDHIVLHKIEKKPDLLVEEEPLKELVYKNSDLIHINYVFQNPNNLRKSDGMDPEYLAKLEEEKKLEEQAKLAEQTRLKASWPNIIPLKDDDIVSIFNSDEEQKNDMEIDEEKTDLDEKNIEDVDTPEIIYKNSTRIKLYSWFENPIILRKGEYIYPVEEDNIEEDNIESENNIEELDNVSEDVDDNSESVNDATIEPVDEDENIWSTENIIEPEETEILTVEPEDNQEILPLEPEETEENIIEDNNTDEVLENEKTVESEETAELLKQEKEAELRKIIGKYIRRNEKDILRKAEKIEIITEEIVEDEVEQEVEDSEKAEEIPTIQPEEDEETEENITEDNNTDEVLENENTVEAEKTAELLRQEKEAELRKIIGKYIRYNVTSILRRAEKVQHDFVIDEDTDWEEIVDSNQLLDQLLINEEIDLDTLESENDEFLQKLFQKTKDEEVMNLIIENYLNEYQFVNAKKFIENLPQDYADKVKPSLNLRVAFNSFPLTSKNISESLKSTVQNYLSKGEISDEDANRYLWVVALMNHNYDYYFSIASWFTSEKYVSFTAKIQWYKDQISKQMWMPDYYFDTLVSLELFNQWLFQPAKVVALSSLQKNTNYILPYQVLAYANFLTNSRDTSIEYLKKLVDLDPNNAEKYRFLMWVAYYWDEKYEQSIVMLSMIKSEHLRLDTQRYLIKDYLKLDQKTKLISIRNKLLWYENLVASDFYTYFYEAFYHPFSEWLPYQIYAFDTELANKMIRVCSMKLSEEEKAVCNYWIIGKNIASWQFDWLEESLLKLVTDYPQWYLYQALWEYYIQQWDTEKAKAYLLKAVSLTKRTPEVVQIKKLLQETM